jgi:geranylgeranyl diphosphate synthase type II
LKEKKKINAVTKIYDKINIKQLVEAQISKLNQDALEYLNKVRVDKEKKAELEMLAERLINRIS